MATIKAITTSAGKTRYRVQIRRKGYPTLSKNFSSKTTARAWARDAELNIDQAVAWLKPEIEKHTLAELIDLYLEQVKPVQTRVRHLSWWRQHLGSKLLTDLSPGDFKSARRVLQTETKLAGGNSIRKTDQHRTPATVNRYMTTASVLLSFGMGHNDGPENWLKENVVQGIGELTEPPAPGDWLRDDQRDALFTACDAASWAGLGVLVRLALYTGGRLSEVLPLRWSQVDFEAGRVDIPRTKNDTAHSMFLTDQAIEVLRAWHSVRDERTDWVFPSPATPLRHYSGWREHWNKARIAAGMPRFKFHTLRHTAVSYLVQAGVSDLVIADVVNHKTLSVTRRYAHLREKDKRDALTRAMNR